MNNILHKLRYLRLDKVYHISVFKLSSKKDRRKIYRILSQNYKVVKLGSGYFYKKGKRDHCSYDKIFINKIAPVSFKSISVEFLKQKARINLFWSSSKYVSVRQAVIKVIESESDSALSFIRYRYGDSYIIKILLSYFRDQKDLLAWALVDA